MTTKQLQVYGARIRLAWFRKAEELGNVSEACKYYGVPRSDYYYWHKRWLERGKKLAGLCDQSRTPHHHPNELGEDIVYVVRDNGIGVPKEQQGKLFTKMFRAKNAQELRPDGTGLGLYLVKRVVEDQGGKLIFESTPGKGSVFGFKIPVHNKIVVDKNAQKALSEAHKND